jgi:biopolymer transport protein ExbD
MKIKRNKALAEIPTVSMGDIAFLLITFFLLTAVFAAIKGINFGLPTDAPENLNVQMEQALHVKVLGLDQYFLNDQPIRIEELGPAIKAKVDQNKNTPVIIETDENAPFEAMIAAFDEVKLAGATRVSLPTQADRQRWQILSGRGR